MESRSEKDILLELVEKAQEYTLISPDEDILSMIDKNELTQNQYILFLSLYAYLASQIEEKLTEVYDNINIDTATGDGLDALGRLVNITRIPAKSSYLDVEIGLPIASEENIVIPEGTRLIFQELLANDTEYVTSQEYTLSAGVTSMTLTCNSSEPGYTKKIPENTVIGLENFNQFSIIGNTESTSGCYIEEDEQYRIRIKKWQVRNQIGTKECVADYLDNLTFLDGYMLIPSFDGKLGSLKIICDTLQSNLEVISNGVKSNCLLMSDPLPVCELPSTVNLPNLTVYVTRGSTLGLLTDEELKQLIIQQVKTFIRGGVDRGGFNVKGLGIGENLNPSSLLVYLVEQFLEVDNIRLSEQEVINVEEDSKLKLGDVVVQFE